MNCPSKSTNASRLSKAVSLPLFRPALYVIISLIILVPVGAQEAPQQPSEQLFDEGISMLTGDRLPHLHTPGCSSATQNDLRSRACFHADQLLETSAVIHALFSAGLSEWRNRPQLRRPDADDISWRFATFYERRAARNAGEFIAGYLHHEDFRPRLSGRIGIRERSKAALLSVVVSKNESGGFCPVFAPIAGSFSSGFVGAADYPNRGLFEAGLRRSSAVYGWYFGKALYQEFKPDLVNFSNRIFRRSR